MGSSALLRLTGVGSIDLERGGSEEGVGGGGKSFPQTKGPRKASPPPPAFPPVATHEAEQGAAVPAWFSPRKGAAVSSGRSVVGPVGRAPLRLLSHPFGQLFSPRLCSAGLAAAAAALDPHRHGIAFAATLALLQVGGKGPSHGGAWLGPLFSAAATFFPLRPPPPPGGAPRASPAPRSCCCAFQPSWRGARRGRGGQKSPDTHTPGPAYPSSCPEHIQPGAELLGCCDPSLPLRLLRARRRIGLPVVVRAPDQPGSASLEGEGALSPPPHPIPRGGGRRPVR